MIAVTGATGAIGGHVARHLSERGIAQRLIVRDVVRAPQLDDAEVRQADGYHAVEQMRTAFEDVDTAFLVPAHESPDRVEEHKTAVDAIAAARVQHIVYLSFLNAAPDATFTLARHHWATEEHIRASGLEFTFLRMSLYMDFIPNMVGDDDVIRGPAGDGRAGAVLRADIAAAAAAVLPAANEHAGKTYDLTGPSAFTFAEAAAALSRATGRQIRFENETVEEAYASRAHYGAPDWEVDGWVSTYTAVAAGEMETVTNHVQRLTGQEPVSLDDYVASA